MVSDDWGEWTIPIAVAVVLWAALSQCSEAQSVTEPDRPMTARDMVLNEARAASLAGPHDEIRCYQVREHGQTRICISEAVWRLQHANDKTEASLSAVAGAD